MHTPALLRSRRSLTAPSAWGSARGAAAGSAHALVNVKWKRWRALMRHSPTCWCPACRSSMVRGSQFAVVNA